MKRALLGILMVTMLVISGCGGGTVSVYVPPLPNPPSITSYNFAKDSANEYINGTVYFYAPDSDIDTITVAGFDYYGVRWSKTVTAVNSPGTQGHIDFSIDYHNYPSDYSHPYTFTVYLTDFNGNTSNQVVDTFWVP